MSKRVAVTGMGVVSPVGTGLEAFWGSLVQGKTGIDKVTRFDVTEMPTKVAGEVKDFDPIQWMDKKESRHLDRFAQFAMAAAQMAMDDARWDRDKMDRERIATVIGCGIGGVSTFEEQKEVLMSKGPGRVSPFFVPMLIGNMAAGQLSIVYGLEGPSHTIQTACASATDAIGEAFRLIRNGEADYAVCGGTEAPITPLAFAGFCAMKAMSAEKENFKEACRPFDRRRSGFVMGEGAGIITLESLERAEARGARIYAELIGYGSTSDAYHITSPAPDGKGAVRAMESALRDGGVAPEEVDYINAHGTGTGANDRSESRAIRKAFGPAAEKVAVSSTKGTTGHLMGAAGGIEAIAGVLSIVQGVIPPTVNYGEPDPDCDLDYVPNRARRQEVRIAMSNTFGFGGHNATILFKKYSR